MVKLRTPTATPFHLFFYLFLLCAPLGYHSLEDLKAAYSMICLYISIISNDKMIVVWLYHTGRFTGFLLYFTEIQFNVSGEKLFFFQYFPFFGFLPFPAAPRWQVFTAISFIAKTCPLLRDRYTAHSMRTCTTYNRARRKAPTNQTKNAYKKSIIF